MGENVPTWLTAELRYIARDLAETPGLRGDVEDLVTAAAAAIDRLTAENERLRTMVGRYPGTPDGFDDLRSDLHSTVHQWDRTSCDDDGHEDFVDDLVDRIIALLAAPSPSTGEDGGK